MPTPQDNSAHPIHPRITAHADHRSTGSLRIFFSFLVDSVFPVTTVNAVMTPARLSKTSVDFIFFIKGFLSQKENFLLQKV